MFSLKVLKANGETKFVERGEREAYLVATSAYEEGDRVVLEYSGEPKYFMFQADDAMGDSLIYVTGNVEIKIPFGELRDGYSPKAFMGELHYIYAREAYDEEIYAYRNQALNVYDNHDNCNSYPHASANVETRGEAVFAAKNAIDGVTANHDHGKWPFASWGINQRDDAEIELEFGREISTDRIVLHTRADFPHDNWWVKGTVEFSDGSSMVLDLEKTDGAQEFTFSEKKISWLVLKDLIKADDPSPFPALTQIEVFGTEC